MIRIVISKTDNLISSITFFGHAMFAPHGKDIVCAGVSSILTTTVNGILRINDDAISHEQNTDEFKLFIHCYDDVTNKLIENMIDLLKSLEINYPKNIKLEEEKTK